MQRFDDESDFFIKKSCICPFFVVPLQVNFAKRVNTY